MKWKPASRWYFQDFDSSTQDFHQRFENWSGEAAVLKGIHQGVGRKENYSEYSERMGGAPQEVQKQGAWNCGEGAAG